MSGIEVEVISHVVEVAPGFGPAGPTGPGVPVGGATGQVLAKASATNFDTQWVDPEAAAAGDHGALAGLADDDHPQYHNDARGDARYAPLAHDHDADYEAIGAAAGAVSAHAAAPSAHPISGVDGLAAALALLAPLASPALTGTPTAPTALAGTASTQLATTAFVAAAIAALLNSAPGALDTLDELAAALGDDPNFATTVTNALAGKLAKASNLSDLTDAAAARTNLGAGAVGAAVFQAATAAAIRTLLDLGGAAVLSVGATAGTVAAGDDARLSDARTPTSHTHALGEITQSGATSGQIATWNGTAWVPQTPSGASPGGSSGQVQYNNGGAFDGAPLWREAANTVTQRNSTTAQAFRIANTWIDASNYELGRAQWVSNVFTIGTIKAGTGVARGLALQVDGTNVVSWHSATLQATFATQTNHSGDIVGIGSYPRLIAFRIAIGPIINTSYTYTTADCGGIAIATSASDQTFTTPASPGSGTQFGMRVGSSKTSYLRINANTGQKIRLAGGLSASAGYVRSNVAGSFVWLIYDSVDAEWVAWQQGGTWTIDS